MIFLDFSCGTKEAMRVLLPVISIFLCAHGAGATNEAGLAYLEEKKSEDGVIALPSGLMYKVVLGGMLPLEIRGCHQQRTTNA